MTHKGNIYPVVVPKWGLTMEAGLLGAWQVNDGATVAVGDELLDIETEKITNTVEATHAGILRLVGKAGETYPCGALIGVIAEASVTEEECAAFIAVHVGRLNQVRAEHHGPAPQMLAVQGRTLRYLTQGTGEIPILLIHGFAGDLNNWLLVQPALAERSATYAIDLPGHGGSSKDLSDINSFEDVADVMYLFLDALGIAKTHIVAHSMGAAIAFAMARRASDRIASLSLLAPVDLGRQADDEFINGVLAAKNRRQLVDVLKTLFVDKDVVSREAVENMLKFKRLDGAEAALAKYAGFLRKEKRPPGEALEGFTQPGIVIWGAQDKIIEPMTDGKLPKNVNLILLNDTGHMPHMEQGATTAELIRTLIERAT
jgi:pyruvate dehydrogenase E2 component (dihydrolipoamide acetyltransferase)